MAFNIQLSMVYLINKMMSTLCLGLLFFATSCEIDPVEPSFGYIYIKSAHLVTDIHEGEATNSITEAWVAVNNQDIGVYQIPGIVPIPSGDEVKITVFPGVRKNDRLTESTIYPMYEQIDLSKQIVPEQTDTIELIYHYKDDAVFDFKEDFESGNGFLENLDTSNLSVTEINEIRTTQSMHGTYDGQIELNELKDHILLGHKIWTSDLKKGAAPVYLEIDSKPDIIYSVLLRGIKNGTISTPDEIARIFPDEQNEWKKGYFDLREIINTRRFDSYQVIIFTAFESTTEMEKVEILLDNIKIVHL